ncbi:MAG: hypothetical protein L7F78_23310, partial [Syntrophales bacterium LBB04]|nr:hypothetical protein [Syntrophales bacterium LBB04]
MNIEMVREKLVAFSSGPAARSLARLKRGAVPLWKLLTFSLADEAILPKRAFAVSIEPSGLTCASGSRFLSRIRIGGVRTYPFEEGKYPSPANLA